VRLFEKSLREVEVEFKSKNWLKNQGDVVFIGMTIDGWGQQHCCCPLNGTFQDTFLNKGTGL
jgi:hypothetical protein